MKMIVVVILLVMGLSCVAHEKCAKNACSNSMLCMHGKCLSASVKMPSAAMPIAQEKEWKPSVNDRCKGEYVVNFGFDESVLDERSQNSLDLLAECMSEVGDMVDLVEGHTDMRGSDVYNKNLGAKRAHAVVQYLQSKKVLTREVREHSYGKERPLDPGLSEEAFAKNRRVFVHVKGSK